MRSPLINEYLSEHRHLDAHVEGRVTVLWRKPKQRFSLLKLALVAVLDEKHTSPRNRSYGDLFNFLPTIDLTEFPGSIILWEET